MFERRQHFLSRVRLDPHRADVRAARPRHDVGLDPLPADARRLRRRHPLHRDLGLPADVRPRHHRHGDDRARERARSSRRRRACSGSTRRPASSRRAMRQNGPFIERGAHHQRAVVPLRRGLRGRGRGPRHAQRRRRLWRQFLRHRRAASPLFGPRRREPVGHPALEPEAARSAFNAAYEIAHPENPAINRLTHVLWTGKPQTPGGTARNAVFYGDKAIDRSPCGTGTSARMAHLAAKGGLAEGDEFVHEIDHPLDLHRPHRGAHQGRQSRGHHPLDRGLGPRHRPQHHHRSTTATRSRTASRWWTGSA